MRKSAYNIGHRPTWAEINLGNLEHNFHQIKKRLKSSTKVLVTIKADAYGHGLIPVAKRLIKCGVDFFGVASIDEGIRLREAGLRIPILVMGMVLKNDVSPLFRYRLIPTVCDVDFANTLNSRSKALGRPIGVHVKIDTGMGRVGVLHHDAQRLLIKIHKLKHINIEGIFTHFPFADMDRQFTLYQIYLFNRLLHNLSKEGIHIPLKHSANSIAVLDYKESHFNMIRPGLAIYGLYPKENLDIHLKPVLSLKTKIIFLKKMPKGYGISYGHDYITKKDTKIAMLPIGYGDGYPRNLSNQAPVLIRGRRFNISGRICMDQVMVDVGSFSARVGDEVVLIGSQGRNKITAEELASLAGTIPYEIVCGLGSRIPRVYID
jgi:alanine racemase